MIQIKKTILTLVALLAVTTGAWADETPLLTIENKDYASFKSGSMTFDDMVTVTFSNEVKNYGSTTGWFSSTGSLLTVAGTNGYTITSCKFYTDAGIAAIGYTVEGESPSVFLSEGYVYTDNSKSVNIGEPGVKKIEVYGGVASSAPSGPKVAWDKDKKTGKFTMPGGNVTLEPEYYPQATVADGGVTAADADARATTDDPLVKVDATKLTGAKKLMYFVSNSGTTAPAYDAEGWTDQLPTAEGLTQQGIVYVWYYPVGIDEGVDGATATYSDGDICLQSITARIAPEPTYPGAKPVYRLYNTKSGDHHYTTSMAEKDKLVGSGQWRDEGIAFYSATAKDTNTIKIYRVYNSRLKRGQHHYTRSAAERDSLVKNSGWKDEGIGFYGYSSAKPKNARD